MKTNFNGATLIHTAEWRMERMDGASPNLQKEKSKKKKKRRLINQSGDSLHKIFVCKERAW